MTILRAPEHLKRGPRQKVCAAIGFFDGVHLGHQEIIRRMVLEAGEHKAVAVVITFDRHPNTVVAPERVPPLIYTFAQKVRAIGSLGPDALFPIHFNKAFSEQSGSEFIHSLSRDFAPFQSLCVGANFLFGHKRSGDIAMLKRLSTELNFEVMALEPVVLDGEAVSSTRIRGNIRRGDLEKASQLLGRPYSLSGKVVAGARIGRSLGFPTANLETSGLVLPPDGVYAAQAAILSASSPTPDGPLRQAHEAVLNIGVRPTVQSGSANRTVEAHLLDFSGDLYGSDLELTLTRRLRNEKRFSSREELQAQIRADIEAARRSFQGAAGGRN
ncbi:MAG TPA: bifunctional riboflavin kinase/FAD synthetase [Verrucomicrobiae bacterium]|nr:bifunctional riboflavin kinase/FAD synthetase [Verrucomicrobiae bacterium]